MAVPLFFGQVIAVIWDFDQTLIPGYQQDPLFEEYDIDRDVFWKEVNSLTTYYRDGAGIQVSSDTVYLNHLLTYVEAGKLPDLNNAKLRELGARLQFYPGVPEFLETAKRSVEDDPKFQAQEITVEHYVVSTGLRQTMLGSAIGPYISDVWGSEFIEEPAAPGFLEKTGDVEPRKDPPVIRQVGYFLDNSTKTRAIWEINKGCNVDPGIDVNASIAEEDRRVPLRNMIYVADGPSDIPVFSILNKNAGRTMGVYNPASDAHFRGVKSLMDQGRVKVIAEANYQVGSTASRWILESLREIADLVVRDREQALLDRVVPPAGHVT